MTNLPPLPPTLCHTCDLDEQYTADQTREYGALCRKQALEEAIQVCKNLDAMSRDPMVAWGSAEECAIAIRELLK